MQWSQDGEAEDQEGRRPDQAGEHGAHHAQLQSEQAPRAHGEPHQEHATGQDDDGDDDNGSSAHPLTITEHRWELLQPLLPAPQRAATASHLDDRAVLNGILDVLRSGIVCEDLRQELGLRGT